MEEFLLIAMPPELIIIRVNSGIVRSKSCRNTLLSDADTVLYTIDLTSASETSPCIVGLCVELPTRIGFSPVLSFEYEWLNLCSWYPVSGARIRTDLNSREGSFSLCQRRQYLRIHQSIWHWPDLPQTAITLTHNSRQRSNTGATSIRQCQLTGGSN